MLRLALRLHRTAWASLAGLGVLYGVLLTLSFPAVVGTSPAGRAQFGQQMGALARQLSYLAALPIRVDTLAGYLQWRMYGGFLPIAFSFWGFMAGSGVIRGDEERGLLELWLAEGMARRRLVGVRLLAFVLVAGTGIAVTALATGLASVVAGEPLAASSLALASVPLLGLTLTCFGIGLIAGQLATTRRGAAGVAGGLVLALFLVNSLSRTTAWLQPYRVVSPFFYYDRTTVLVQGGVFDLGATLGLVAAALALSAVGAAGFKRRDLGAALIRRRARTAPPSYAPASSRLLELPILRLITQQPVGLAAWLIGIALTAALFGSVTRATVDVMRSTPRLQAYLALLGGGNLYQAVVGFFWFGTLEFLLAIYTITQVARWTSEEAEGRLDMVLSEPVPRWSVVVERAIALLVTSGCLIAAGTLATAAVSASQQITLDPVRVVEAAALLLPFALAFGSAGALLVAFVPRAAWMMLAAYAVAAYFLQQFGLLLKWPKPIVNLSVFELYGAPLATGVYWTGLWILLVVTGVGLISALILMQRRDLGR